MAGSTGGDAVEAHLLTTRSTREGLDPSQVNRVRPAYQQVADQLRDRILDGSLGSGDRLPTELDLAEIFGVSRSTVREALRVLASRDLIYTTRGTTGGTFVSRVQFDKVSDYLETSLGLMSGTEDITLANLLEAREVLEVPAAGLAALRHEEHHLGELRAIIEREQQTRGRGHKFREHRNFHSIVVDAADNGLLGVMAEPVFRVLQARLTRREMGPDFWRQIDDDHLEILGYIQGRDSDSAAAAMKTHLSRLNVAYHDAEPTD